MVKAELIKKEDLYKELSKLIVLYFLELILVKKGKFIGGSILSENNIHSLLLGIEIEMEVRPDLISNSERS